MNAWWVAKELAYRIDGAPVFCEYIHCSATENPSDAFFFNNEYLKHFQKATEGIRKETPGYFYIMKIMKFMEEPTELVIFTWNTLKIDASRSMVNNAAGVALLDGKE